MIPEIKGRPLSAIGVETKDWHKGTLVKANLLHCPVCPRVYIPTLQASKVDEHAAEAGWYENKVTATAALDLPGFDVVVRISPGKRGLKRCEDHRIH